MTALVKDPPDTEHQELGASKPATRLAPARVRVAGRALTQVALAGILTGTVVLVTRRLGSALGELATTDSVAADLLLTALWFGVLGASGGLTVHGLSHRIPHGLLAAGLITVVAFVAIDHRGIAAAAHAVVLLCALTAAFALAQPAIVRIAEFLVPPRSLRVSSAPANGRARTAGRGERVAAFGTRALRDPDLVRAAVIAELEARHADRIVLDLDVPPDVIDLVSWELRGTGVDLRLGSRTLPHIDASRLVLPTAAPAAELGITAPRARWPHRALRRLLDVVAAGAGLLMLAPILALIALLVRHQDGGPSLFRQERIGRDGKPFTILKFRTMVLDADAQLTELLAQQSRGGTPLFKVDDDPRITPLGRVLRDTSLDELPQLVNVLTGAMSLIGPRPQRREEVELYTERDRRRLDVRPGITGLWQISGRSRLGWEQARDLDLRYVENPSILMDLRILIATVGVVLRRDGAQ